MIRIKSYVGFSDKVFDAESFLDIDLADIDFHRYLFEDFDMSGCSFISFKGRGVIFKDSVLRNADLTSANLCVSRLINCIFDGATLRKANFQGTRIRGCSFVNADLTEANLEGAKFLEVKLEGAILTGASYSNSTVWPAGFLPEEHGTILGRD